MAPRAPSRPGCQARSLRAGPEAPGRRGGHIWLLAPFDFEVVITLDATDVQLRPDLSATADIVTDISPDAVSIPIIALTVREPERDTAEAAARRDTQDEEGVFVVKDGKVTFIPVKVGIAGQEFFEVLDGVNVGDTVVAGPYQRIRQLKDGDPVKRMAAIDAVTAR